MPATLLMIWDYDSALGQINSQLPYNFHYTPIYQEMENVENIIKLCSRHKFKMTFACLGFAAEPGNLPFNNPEQIKKISDEGHEIASHSWKHEWFPYLTEAQVYKSLERSKNSLEKCLGKSNTVNGFVPPHSRPMSWYKKFSFSLGDRGFYPFHKGADLGFVIKQLSNLNYKWCRVLKSYKPLWEKISNTNNSEINFNKWETHDNIVCVPQHYTGFDEGALNYLHKAIELNETAVIVGHPAALNRNGAESQENFNRFIQEVVIHNSEGTLDVITVTEFIDRKYLTGAKKN